MKQKDVKYNQKIQITKSLLEDCFDEYGLYGYNAVIA